MSYKLYTDKNEIFECEVSIKNASLKGSMARLIVEGTDGVNFVFNGKLENGKCTVPIRRLKGLLEENAKGKIHLEIVVEETFFKPWESDFIVEEHTSVKVSVNESVAPSKPIVNVKTPIQTPRLHIGAAELVKICERFSITKKSIAAKAPLKRKELATILKEYFKHNSEYNNQRKEILEQFAVILK